MEKSKKVFSLDTKIGQTVYDIKINIVPNARRSVIKSAFDSEGIFIEKLKIVYQTKSKIALSGNYIPVLDRRKLGEKSEFYKYFLEDISVSIKTKEDYFNNGIFAHCYTLQEPDKIIKKMTAKISEKVKSEYGFLANIDIWEKVESMTKTIEENEKRF